MEAIFDEGAPAPCPAPFNLAEYVLSQAKVHPEKIALAVVGATGQEQLTYEQLRSRVLRTAGGLKSLGLAPQDRVLLRLGNSATFPVAFLACVAAGLIPVPTSTQLTTREVTTVAREIGARLILASEGVALPEPPSCSVLNQEALAELGGAEPIDFERGDPDRPAYFIYTSGSSGRPRAVVHAHRAVWARRMMIDGWYGLRPSDRVMHAGAFNWTYTLGTGLFDPWSTGATALVPVVGTPAELLPDLMKSHDATLFAAAPGVYRRLLRSQMPNLPMLRHGLSAGEKLPSATLELWRDSTGTHIYEAFGMSECSTFISGSPSRPAPPHSIGFAQPGRRVAVLRPEGVVAACGEVGEIAVHKGDPGLMLEYLGAAKDTRDRFTKDGKWFRTGDMADMSEDGALRYHGRSDDMMNAGGYRVSPLEVEAILTQFPLITDAACVEISVKADTTIIAAFYSAEKEIDSDQLRAFTSDRLARYKCPKQFIHTPVLPRSANGKLMRTRLRQDFEASHDQA